MNILTVGLTRHDGREQPMVTLSSITHRSDRPWLRVVVIRTRVISEDSVLLSVLGALLRNTKFNAETAEPAEKNPLKLCDLCVLCVQTS